MKNPPSSNSLRFMVNGKSLIESNHQQLTSFLFRYRKWMQGHLQSKIIKVPLKNTEADKIFTLWFHIRPVIVQGHPRSKEMCL